MKHLKSVLLLSFFVAIQSVSAQVDANLTFRNYIKTDISVDVESYDKKGNLKVNESFIVSKATAAQDGSTNASEKAYTTKGFKNGNIKIKYHPTESNSQFTLDPIQVPDSRNALNKAIALTGLVLYDVNDGKQRMISLGTNLKFDSTSKFTRMIDMKAQLGSLIIAKKENGNLNIKDLIPLKDIDIVYDQPNKDQQSIVTERSVVSSLKVAIPIYGSVEADMSNSDLHQVKWDISYYPFQSNVSFSTLIENLDQTSKRALINKLKMSDTTMGIYILRAFDVIESGVFAVTTATKITSEGSAAIASVFTASGAYAFKSEDSRFVSIPNRAYNTQYEQWQSVGSLIKRLESQLAIPVDGRVTPNVMNPLMNIQ